MNPRPTPTRRGRLQLLAIMAVFALPVVAAMLAVQSGWRPSTNAAGQPVDPPRDLRTEQVRIDLAGGGRWRWKDAEPRETLIALAGPGCAARCFDTLTAIAKARVMLNRNQDRLRLLYVGSPPADTGRVDAMRHYWALGTDPAGRLAAFVPQRPDSVAVLLVQPDGEALSFYPAGFDAMGLARDLQKVVR